MANNVATYIGNIGKSVTYAAVDKFKSMAPATADFAENNAELYKSIYDSVRNYKNTYEINLMSPYNESYMLCA